jgi:hypothetical protein
MDNSMMSSICWRKQENRQRSSKNLITLVTFIWETMWTEEFMDLKS